MKTYLHFCTDRNNKRRKETMKQSRNSVRWALAVAVASMASLGASASVVEVTSVAQLTNAVARANAGEAIDTIRLMKSGNPYVFNDEWMGIVTTGIYCGTNFLNVSANLTFEGEDASSRSGWTDHEEPVIVDGGGRGRILSVESGKTVTVKNIAFTGGYCCYGSVSSYGGVACSAQSKYNVTFTNCVFRQNSAKSGGAVVFNCVLYDCLITNNFTCSAVQECDSYKCDYIGNTVRCLQNPNKHYDCTFIANGSEATSDGVICFCNGGILLSNCVIRANAPKGRKALCGHGGTYIDCLFEDNDAAPGTSNATYSPTIKGCTFRRNGGLCAGNPMLVDGCLFEDTSGDSPINVENLSGGFESRIVNSTFRRNNAKPYGNGGAIHCSLRYDAPTYLGTCFVSNCVFECNAATNMGSGAGGAIYNGGSKAPEQWKFPTATMPCDYMAVYDCTFKSNIATACGGVYGVTAVRCRFEGNRKQPPNSAYVGVDAWKCRLVDCNLDGGMITDCILDRCRISSVANVDNIFQNYIRATNTVVEACSSFGLYGVTSSFSKQSYDDLYYTNRVMDAEFVNCTFVTNFTYTLKIPSTAIHATNGVLFANCLFYGNNNNYYDTDLDAYKDGNSYTCYWDRVSFTRSCYKKVDARGIPQYAINPPPPEDFFLCVDPKFVKDSIPGIPYWSLMHNSPLCGMGDTLGFTDSDLDLAGKLRLRDGKIDIGCYQCWLSPPGFMMIVR